MEKKETYIGVEQIQKIKMSTEEKDNILNNIMDFYAPTKRPFPTPYTFSSFLSSIQRHQSVYYGVLSFFVLILGGGGVIFASQDSVPGNILYPIKISVIEPINSSLKFSLEEKAQYQGSLAKERLVEAQILAYKGKLDPVKEKQINDLLVVHTNAFDKAIEGLNKNNSNEKAYNIAVNFKDEMQQNAKTLDYITNKTAIMGKENSGLQISTTARNNAEKIKILNKEEKEDTYLADKKEEDEEKNNGYVKKETPITDSEFQATSVSSPALGSPKPEEAPAVNSDINN